jgi:predicted alpha-1,2-mannosidase
VDDPLAYVDPFIGSGGFGYAAGSAFPGAAAPFGMAKVGPDTNGPFGPIRFLHFSGYWYDDDKVQGFSHLHLHGTGATDYGVLTVMPVDAFDGTRTTPDGYESPFAKSTEEASPGYYAVTLDRGSVRAELTATKHAAHHRYTYPASATEGHLVVDLAHALDSGKVTHGEVTLDPATQSFRGVLHSVGGMSDGFGGYDVFFDARTRAPWKKASVWADGKAPAEGLTATGEKVGFALSFDLAKGTPIELQVGISLVSLEDAGKNRAAEITGWDFEATRDATRKAWADLVGTMKLWGGTEADRRMFYSALYRAFLMPTITSDVDGSYRYAGQEKTADGFSFCTDQSLWDTYRTVTPLYALVAPGAARDVVRSLHAMAQTGGFFPKWPIATGEAGTMLGASADIVVGEAYIKGITDFDAEGAYAILRAAAMDMAEPQGGRGGRSDVVPYMQYGYVPADHGRSVSQTLEYANDDLALAGLAGALGKDDDRKTLEARALSHRKLFDPKTGFLRARNADGSFAENNFSPYTLSDHFAEANAWQSLWAQHDIPGIAELLGGQQAFVDKLTQFFEEGIQDLADRPIDDNFASAAPRSSYWHGNEPDIHAAYGFAQVGRPDLTQKYLRWVLRTHYNDKANGLAGNDDGGTLSSWFVFTAAGIYPIPGTDRYVIGAPLFPRIDIQVRGGVLHVEAPEVSAENMYVQAVTWNEKPVEKPELLHGDIAQGGTLHFKMGASPGAWGRK